MTFDLEQFQRIYFEIQPQLLEAIFTKCMQVSSHRFVFIFKTKSHDLYLLICLKHPFIRFHLSSQKILGLETPFVKTINNLLAHSKLQSFTMINNDRILSFNFINKSPSLQLIVEFFPRHPNIYIVNPQNEILTTFYPSNKTCYQAPTPPLQVKKTSLSLLSNLEIEKFYQTKEIEAEVQEEKKRLETLINNRLKKTEKWKIRCQEDLLNCQNWKNIRHMAVLIQSNLFQIKKDAKEVWLTDWENEGKKIKVLIDPSREPYEEMTFLFKKSKKLESGIKYIGKHLIKAEQEIDKLHHLLSTLSTCESLAALKEFEKANHLSSEEKPLPTITVQKKGSSTHFREFVTTSGLKLWVGKSAKDNETLTFQFGKGSDWWFHANEVAGSHVILRPARNQIPDNESIQDAIQLALYYSKAKKQNGGEVLITQQKYVSRPKNRKTGQVNVSKHRIVYAEIDPKRYQDLKERSISSTL